MQTWCSGVLNKHGAFMLEKAGGKKLKMLEKKEKNS